MHYRLIRIRQRQQQLAAVIVTPSPKVSLTRFCLLWFICIYKSVDLVVPFVPNCKPLGKILRLWVNESNVIAATTRWPLPLLWTCVKKLLKLQLYIMNFSFIAAELMQLHRCSLAIALIGVWNFVSKRIKWHESACYCEKEDKRYHATVYIHVSKMERKL